MSIKIEDRPQTLTQGEIENFLQAAGTAGLRASTLRRYRSDLVALQHYLGAGACIRSGTLLQWVADMHAQGYAPRSIVARVLTVNRFLQYQALLDERDAALARVTGHRGDAHD